MPETLKSKNKGFRNFLPLILGKSPAFVLIFSLLGLYAALSGSEGKRRINLSKVPLMGDTTEEVIFFVSPQNKETLAYEISFGDGERYRSSFTPLEIEAQHLYKKPGRYQIIIAVYDRKGKLGEETTAIEISPQLFLYKIELPSATISTPALDGADNIYLGLEDNALISFKKDGTFRFSFSTRNSVYATPILFNDKVLFGALDSSLYCLDTTGRLLWQFPAKGEIYQAAATDGKKIVFVTDDGQVFCLTMNGKLSWQGKIGPEPLSPTIDKEGNIFITADGVYGFSPSGKPLFLFKTAEEDAFLTPGVLTPGGLILAGCENGYLYCLNRKGELLWKAPTEEEDCIRCEGIFKGDTFFFGADDGVLYKKGRYGTPVKFFATDGEIIASPVITKDGRIFIFSDDGYLYCLREDGQLLFTKEVAYSEKGFFITPSLTLTSDGVLLVTSWDETLFAFPAEVSVNPSLWHTYRGNSQRQGRIEK